MPFLRFRRDARPRARRGRSGDLGPALLVSVLLAPAIVRAASDECGKATKRWVAVRLSGPGWSPALASAVLTDLRAEVVRHGIDTCPVDTPGLPPPIATMDMEAREPTTILQPSPRVLPHPASGRRPLDFGRRTGPPTTLGSESPADS